MKRMQNKYKAVFINLGKSKMKMCCTKSADVRMQGELSLAIFKLSMIQFLDQIDSSSTSDT